MDYFLQLFGVIPQKSYHNYLYKSTDTFLVLKWRIKTIQKLNCGTRSALCKLWTGGRRILELGIRLDELNASYQATKKNPKKRFHDLATPTMTLLWNWFNAVAIHCQLLTWQNDAVTSNSNCFGRMIGQNCYRIPKYNYQLYRLPQLNTEGSSIVLVNESCSTVNVLFCEIFGRTLSGHQRR